MYSEWSVDCDVNQCVTFNCSKGKSAVGRIHPLDSHGKLDFSGLTYVDLVKCSG